LNSKKRPIFFAIIICVIIIIILYGPTDNWSWDPSFYYAQMRSPLIDNDLDFRDETLPPNGISDVTVTGLQPSQWPIGPGLLWSPFFLAAHLLVLITHQSDTSGLSLPYVAFVSAGSMLIGLLGGMITYRICRYFGGLRISILSTLAAIFASPLIFYIFRQPIMAHSTSFFSSAFLLLASILALKGELPLKWTGFVLGVAVGLSGLLRWTNALQAIIPMGVFVILAIDSWKLKDQQQMRAILLQVAVFFGAALLTFTPQMILWYRLHHRFLIYPFVTDGFSLNESLTNIISLFIHTNRGLLFWSPYLLIGLIGIFWLEDHRLRALLAVYLLVFIVLLGSWSNWYGGGGYGPRFFIEALPIAAIGFVALFQRYRKKRYWGVGVSILFILLIIHQIGLLLTVEHAATLAWIPLGDYFTGKPLGISIFWEGLGQIIQNPAILLLPRPYVLPERQTLLVTLVNGTTSLRSLMLPVTALLIVPAGLLLFWFLVKNQNSRWIGFTALALFLWMIVWDIILLSV
jgi:hypothetical protein